MPLPVQRKSIALAGTAFLALALFHIPDFIFRHAFDKNASGQFFTLLLVSSAFAFVIASRTQSFNFRKLPIFGVIALVVAEIISLATSKNLWGSFIGDSGRFVGVASVIGLLTVSLFHARLNYQSFITLLRYYIAAIEIVSVIGIAQHFNLIELPGDQGVTSTLGNTDFFAAFIATSFPLLILVALELSRRGRLVIGFAALVNIFALYLAGPLQGFLDIVFILLAYLLFRARRFIPRRDLTLNVRTFLGTFAVIIWAEFIFLMPFLGKAIPVLGNDVQVQIRGNFWLAGMKQFFDHPFTGVGPDNYGSYYEQYRTLEDVSKYTNIVSNDAHSASVQTFATLGILGILAFLFLIAILIRSILILWDNRSVNRSALYFIGAYVFVYLTNSFISPITITNKYLFWATAGVVIGWAYKKRVVDDSPKAMGVRVLGFGFSTLLLSTGIIFGTAQINYLTHIEKYAVSKTSTVDYQSAPAMPCFMYFDAEMLMVAQAGDQRAISFANQRLAKNPRCIAAELFLARMAVSVDDMKSLKPHIYRLMDLAPARSETISIGMYYANRAGDKNLAIRLEKVMQTLGLVYLPGKLG